MTPLLSRHPAPSAADEEVSSAARRGGTLAQSRSRRAFPHHLAGGASLLCRAVPVRLTILNQALAAHRERPATFDPTQRRHDNAGCRNAIFEAQPNNARRAVGAEEANGAMTGMTAHLRR